MRYRIFSCYKTVFFLLLTCLVTHNLPAQTHYGNNERKGKYIQLNGVMHYYETYGSGKAMLLIHGNSTGISGWAAQIDYFSKKYKVYAIDCRGRGKSELGKDTLTYMQQSLDMAAFISTLHLDSVLILGKSDGAIVALLLAIYHPEHIEKIAAFGANIRPDNTALYPDAVQQISKDRKHAEQMLKARDGTKDWELVRQLNRMMEFQPFITVEELQQIRIPVLIMSCDRDLIREEHTLFIYQHIPMAALSFLPGETHSVPKQNPALFNSVVEHFYKSPFREPSYRFTGR
jgi:pimeloyl-ACP methyl ester carboxylesterase